AQAGRVLGVERHDAGADEPRGQSRPGADDLAGVAPLKVVQGVVAGHDGNAGDEQGEPSYHSLRRYHVHETSPAAVPGRARPIGRILRTARQISTWRPTAQSYHACC